MAHPAERRGRAEPREILELHELKSEHPELAAAVDLQVELLKLQRRVQARIPHPSLRLDPGRLREQHESGRALLRFEDIPLSWTDVRLMFREAAGAMRRHDALEEEDFRRAEALGREAGALQPVVTQWYAAAAAGRDGDRAAAEATDVAIDQIVLVAMRPFLTRCAEAILPAADLSGWQRGWCPLCGGEPELAEITPAADRVLICSRCLGRWRFDPLACPACRNADRRLITSFASRDGRYRIYGCDVCRRYLKAYDARTASRPVMVQVDAIATLPLDAAAMQKGYK